MQHYATRQKVLLARVNRLSPQHSDLEEGNRTDALLCVFELGDCPVSDTRTHFIVSTCAGLGDRRHSDLTNHISRRPTTRPG